MACHPLCLRALWTTAMKPERLINQIALCSPSCLVPLEASAALRVRTWGRVVTCVQLFLCQLQCYTLCSVCLYEGEYIHGVVDIKSNKERATLLHSSSTSHSSSGPVTILLLSFKLHWDTHISHFAACCCIVPHNHVMSHFPGSGADDCVASASSCSDAAAQPMDLCEELQDVTDVMELIPSSLGSPVVHSPAPLLPPQLYDGLCVPEQLCTSVASTPASTMVTRASCQFYIFTRNSTWHLFVPWAFEGLHGFVKCQSAQWVVLGLAGKSAHSGVMPPSTRRDWGTRGRWHQMWEMGTSVLCLNVMNYFVGVTAEP